MQKYSKKQRKPSIVLAGQDVVLVFAWLVCYKPITLTSSFCYWLGYSYPIPLKPPLLISCRYAQVAAQPKWKTTPAENNSRGSCLLLWIDVPGQRRLCHPSSILIIYWSPNPLLLDCMWKAMRRSGSVVCDEIAFQVVTSQWHCHRKSTTHRQNRHNRIYYLIP